MEKTIEATWREGFLRPDALVAPKINNLYTRKSSHIAGRIQRRQRIWTIVNVIVALITGAFAALFTAVKHFHPGLSGMPYFYALLCALSVGQLVVKRLNYTTFQAPASSLDSYQYLKAFQRWLKDRMARSRRVLRHVYAATFLVSVFGFAASPTGQDMIRAAILDNPGVRLVYGVPVVAVAVALAIAAVIEIFGGALRDFDVNLAYGGVFRKLDQMVAEMEELRGIDE